MGDVMNKVHLGIGLGLFALFGGVPTPSRACSICDGSIKQRLTLREEAARASSRVILVGTIHNARLAGGGGAGACDLKVSDVLRETAAVKGKALVVLPRYLPVLDPKNPPLFLVYCDETAGKLDPLRGVQLKSKDSVAYLKKALALGDKDPAGNLPFFFKYLTDPDPEVARDAFIEFAKSNDQVIAKAAPKLPADKLRALLKDPATPANQLGVYALLLGAAGEEADAKFLRDLLDRKEERYVNASNGLLAGYIQRKPKEGWKLTQDILKDGKRPLILRLNVLRTIRFFQGARPKESRAEILKAFDGMLAQGELADMAIEDLRTWKVWDLTPQILKVYGRKECDSPLMQRAIIRYALSCTPTAEAKAFLAKRKAADAELVKEVEESLEIERAN
jgi:hypothetical protein